MKVNTRDFVQEYTLLECIQCGRCTGGCPVSMKTALNIRGIIYEALIEDTIELSGMEVLWDCTNCLTCTTRCPKDIQPADVIIGLRGYIVGEGKGVPPRVRDALMSAFTRGNTLGFATEDREQWAEELDFEVKNVLDEGETDLLFYVGCTPAYDPRIQPVTRALATVFQRAGIDFGTMGMDEMCCGNEIKRIGEAEGFESMVEEYHEMLQEFQARRMVTVSPHCFNTFKNEYGEMPFPVQHYTQLLAELLDGGKLAFSNEVAQEGNLPRPLLPGQAQPDLRRAAPHPAEHPRRRVRGPGPLAGAERLLRGRRRPDVGRGHQRRGAAGPPAGARRGGPGRRGAGRGLPLLPADPGGRGQDPGAGRADPGDGHHGAGGAGDVRR